jgi:hypothetical protein
MGAAVTITPADLAPFAEIPQAKAEAMIEDAMARAAVVAPCITSDQFEHTAAAKAIIRGAILRWHESGSGALTSKSKTTGPFSDSESIDTRQARRGMFWPSEIDELKSLCSTAGSGGAFSVDTVGFTSAHAPTCSLNFGATYCSCGVDIAGVPIFDPEP